jgi:hypothetical protein
MRAKTYDGQTARFLASVATCMPPLSSDVMQGYIDDLPSLKLKLASLSPPKKTSKKPRQTVPPPAATFVVSGYGDGRAPAQVMQAGRFDTIWDAARSFVNGKHFPTMTSDTDDIEFEYVEFDHDPTSEEVLAEIARRGLERPTAEDALRFAERYPEEQRKAPVVFLHEPWRDAFGYRRVLYLDGWDGMRSLLGGYFVSGWRRQCRFPARRPRK